MNKKLFAIKDLKAQYYLKLIEADHEAVVVRSIQQDVQNEKSPLRQFPQDFELFKLGEFNTETGELIPIQPEHVLNVISLLPKEEA